MTQEIEPGDLIRAINGDVTVCQVACSCCEVIAKGSPDAPWTRHDGSATNPVPGAEVAAYGRSGVDGILQYNGENPRPSENVSWKYAEFYRVTTPAPSQPPTPQPGWVATAELRFFENQGGMAGITFPSGWTHYVDPRTIDKLDWSPPPPPPWEPEIGKDADWRGDLVIVRGIFEGRAWLEDFEGDLVTVPLSDLSPPKGGEA